MRTRYTNFQPRLYVCAAVHYDPEPFTTPEEEIQLGSGLTEEMRQEVLFVLSKHRKCFPSSEKLGSTSLVEFTIDTGDAKPVRSNPIRVSSIERRIIAQKVEKFLCQGLVRGPRKEEKPRLSFLR